MTQGIENLHPGNLCGFTGSVNWYKHFVPGIYLTDGAQYVSENGAGWLIDAVASYQFEKQLQGHEFQIWELTVSLDEKKAVLTCKADEDELSIVEQKIPYTDFPMEKFTLYCSFDGTNKIIYLPNEY